MGAPNLKGVKLRNPGNAGNEKATSNNKVDKLEIEQFKQKINEAVQDEETAKKMAIILSQMINKKKGR